jgi:protein gp37
VGKDTGISWTDHTFNPWWGCTKVSLGCDHCYAETQDAKFSPDPHWGKGVARRTFGDAHWNEPLKWQKAAEKAGRTEKVFCASMADVMDDEAPEGQRERLWDVINQTPNLLWQLLTKRPQRYTRYLPKDGFRHDNVILGTTTENQQFYNVRMRLLNDAVIELRLRGFVHQVQNFISYEPALGPIKMGPLHPDWVIFGGETGAGRRPMELAWAEAIKAECEYIGIPFFMKQMSAFRPATAASMIPAHLLVRQFPEVA